MKNSEKKTIGKNILNGSLSFIKGVAGGVNPLLGAAVGAAEGVVKGIQKEKDNNLNSDFGGVGSIDWPRLIGVLVFLGLVALLVTGKIDMETLDELIKIFNKTQ